MEIVAFGCLAIVWAAFLVPPALRKHREGRPSSSVVLFRRQLSTLERATPGTTLRPLGTQAAMNRLPAAPVVKAPPPEVAQRRREVLMVLGGASVFTFLVAFVATSLLTVLLFSATAGALGAYLYALVQIRQRAEEAAIKVRVLRPQRIGSSAIAVRRTVNS